MYLSHDQVVGIPIDRHVLQFCLDYNWCTSKSSELAATQVESWLPKLYWGSLNDLIAGTCQLIQNQLTQKDVIQEAELMGKNAVHIINCMIGFTPIS